MPPSRRLSLRWLCVPRRADAGERQVTDRITKRTCGCRDVYGGRTVTLLPCTQHAREEIERLRALAVELRDALENIQSTLYTSRRLMCECLDNLLGDCIARLAPDLQRDMCVPCAVRKQLSVLSRAAFLLPAPPAKGE